MLPEMLMCFVIAVTDGDTLKVRCQSPAPAQPLTVRIATIDAPETGQPYGRRSQQSLRALCLRQSAVLHVKARDRWGRVIADVHCDGQDVGLTQVTRGMAWAYGRGRSTQAARAQEEMARAQHMGLWAGKNPVAPWKWRKDNPARH